jgi:hypothetical protein
MDAEQSVASDGVPDPLPVELPHPRTPAMITLVQVRQILTAAQRPDLVPHAPLLMQITNIYGDPGFDGYVDVALRHLAGPGDVLFWEQTEHIAIALGRRWVNGISEDHIMSHWHNNDWHDDAGRFSALTLEDLPVWLQTDFRFVPCPF